MAWEILDNGPPGIAGTGVRASSAEAYTMSCASGDQRSVLDE